MTTMLPAAPEIETRSASRRPTNDMRQLNVERRAALEDDAREILDLAETENRDLTDAEQQRYDARLEEIQQITERLDRIDSRSRDTREPRPGSVVHVTRDEGIYRPDNGTDFVADVIRWRIKGDHRALERLSEHATQMETRDISRTDTAGGDFVPPAWLMDAYAPAARAGRVFADRFARFPLPGGTDTLNIPKITTGASVDVQTADNANVAEVDMVTATVPAPVRTLAGQQDAALQLLEQSPIPMDRVIFEDLLGDYARRLDLQCLAGSGSSGQVQGVLGLSGINTVTYTDASPTLQDLYPKGADAINQIATTRFLPPEAIMMHPRRWLWMLATLDSSGRPLVVPTGAGPNNAAATAGQLNTDGPVGTWHGLPVFIDANIATNLGGGTNEDRIIIGRFSDGHLYESTPRMRVLPEVGSGTLTVRVQLYNYVAFAPGRYAPSYTVIAGTGLATPSF